MTPSSPQNHRWKGRSHSVGDEKGLGMVSMIMVVMMILTHIDSFRNITMDIREVDDEDIYWDLSVFR